MSKGDNYDQNFAIASEKLDGAITGARDFRAKRLQQFGVIDPYRLARDLAASMLKKLDPFQAAILLGMALDRLGQMPDFQPETQLALADLDFPTPDISEEEK